LSSGYGLVIFDCDGVLVDSEPVSNRIFAAALSEIGLEMSYEEVCREFIGLTLSRCIEIVESRLGRPVPEGFVDDLQARTFQAMRESLKPVRGVAEALDRIELPVCVASSGEPDKMRLTLGLTGLAGRFEGRMFSASEVARGKPFPDLFLHAARVMGVEPHACAVVEDSLPGVRAARAAGMGVYGYAASSDARALAGAGAVVFDEMRELPGLLMRMGGA
jgi:HAD superfamily hydrolase (TIGR01509 family)